MAIRDNIVGKSEETFIGEGLSYYGHTFAIPNGAKALMCEGNYGLFFIDLTSMRATNGSTNTAFAANVTSAQLNDAPFLAGRSGKTIETRYSNSLDPYIGKRIGLIETGRGKAKLKGYATITERIKYDSLDSFLRDVNKHLVEPGDTYCTWYGDTVKYGYVLSDVEMCDPVIVKSFGIVSREI